MTPWRTAERAYQAHHFNCPTCIAAGISQGKHERCPEGAALWKTYSAQPIPEQIAGSSNRASLRMR